MKWGGVYLNKVSWTGQVFMFQTLSCFEKSSEGCVKEEDAKKWISVNLLRTKYFSLPH